MVVVAPGHRWARRRVDVEDLSEEAFICREKGSGTRQVIEDALEKMGVSLNVRMGIGSTSAIKEAIEAGLGFSILSRETIRLELEGGYLAVAEGIVIPRRLSIVCYPSAAMSLVEQAFHDYLLGVRERYGMPREVSAERRSASPPLSLRVLSEREDPISDSGGDGEATLGGAYRIRRVYRKLVKMRGRKYYTGSRCL